MNINRLTEKAQEATVAAQRLAEEQNHNQIEVEHLLYALLDQPEGLVSQIMRRLQVDPEQAKQQVAGELARLPKVYGGQVYVSSRLKRVFDLAEQEASRLKDEFVSTEHLLLAIADEGDKGAGGRVLRSLRVTREQIYQVLSTIRGDSGSPTRTRKINIRPWSATAAT